MRSRPTREHDEYYEIIIECILTIMRKDQDAIKKILLLLLLKILIDLTTGVNSLGRTFLLPSSLRNCNRLC